MNQGATMPLAGATLAQRHCILPSFRRHSRLSVALLLRIKVSGCPQAASKEIWGLLHPINSPVFVRI